MNMRRYALFLIVAILTFVIGVTAAVLVGKVSPFAHQRRAYSRCSHLSALPALPAPKSRLTVYTVYRYDGTVLRSFEVDDDEGFVRFGEAKDEVAPPPPPPAVTDAASTQR
ncbi:MAG TPA: hypothetical protein VGC66_20170 [Pyrinomonadaceae bacterium]|jgi:hypothetical protein